LIWINIVRFNSNFWASGTGKIPGIPFREVGEDVMNSGTMKFDFNNENTNQTREVILKVYEALTEKGYNPISQLVGYIMSGDPTYITNHKNARSLIRRLERDEIIEELVRYYLK